MTQVLSGVRVVELASWTYVPSAGAALADWGADVIKVEDVKAGDPGRALVIGGFTKENARAARRLHPRNRQPRQAQHRDRHQVRHRPRVLRSPAGHRGRVPDQLAARPAGAGPADGRGHPLVQPEHHHRPRHRHRRSRTRPRQGRIRRRHLPVPRRGVLHHDAVRHRDACGAGAGFRRPAGRHHTRRRCLRRTVPSGTHRRAVDRRLLAAGPGDVDHRPVDLGRRPLRHRRHPWRATGAGDQSTRQPVQDARRPVDPDGVPAARPVLGRLLRADRPSGAGHRRTLRAVEQSDRQRRPRRARSSATGSPARISTTGARRSPTNPACGRRWPRRRRPSTTRRSSPTATSYANVDDQGNEYQIVAAPVQFNETPPAAARAPEHGQHTEEILLELDLDWDDISAAKDSGAIL